MTDKNSTVETLRVQIAACTRIMNMDGLIDYSGHISARLPDSEGLLIQSFDDSARRSRRTDCWSAIRMGTGSAAPTAPFRRARSISIPKS